MKFSGVKRGTSEKKLLSPYQPLTKLLGVTYLRYAIQCHKIMNRS
jgi:hypothetical protein